MIQVIHPLCDRNMISARLDAVSEVVESMGSSRALQNIGGLDGEDSDITIVQSEFSYLLSSVLTNLGRSPDIQRGITRIFHQTATPSEVINRSSFGLLLYLHTSFICCLPGQYFYHLCIKVYFLTVTPTQNPKKINTSILHLTCHPPPSPKKIKIK